MTSSLIAQLGTNGLPYAIPIHPNLVHLTLGLFIVAIGFDIVGVLFPLEKPVFKVLAIPATRSNFFDVGWYNILAAAVVTFFTVAAGFYEIMLVDPPCRSGECLGVAGHGNDALAWRWRRLAVVADCRDGDMARISAICLASK